MGQKPTALWVSSDGYRSCSGGLRLGIRCAQGIYTAGGSCPLPALPPLVQGAPSSLPVHLVLYAPAFPEMHVWLFLSALPRDLRMWLPCPLLVWYSGVVQRITPLSWLARMAAAARDETRRHAFMSLLLRSILDLIANKYGVQRNQLCAASAGGAAAAATCTTETRRGGCTEHRCLNRAIMHHQTVRPATCIHCQQCPCKNLRLTMRATFSVLQALFRAHVSSVAVQQCSGALAWWLPLPPWKVSRLPSSRQDTPHPQCALQPRVCVSPTDFVLRSSELPLNGSLAFQQQGWAPAGADASGHPHSYPLSSHPPGAALRSLPPCSSPCCHCRRRLCAGGHSQCGNHCPRRPR